VGSPLVGNALGLLPSCWPSLWRTLVMGTSPTTLGKLQEAFTLFVYIFHLCMYVCMNGL
jgi:hypothetical protein